MARNELFSVARLSVRLFITKGNHAKTLRNIFFSLYFSNENLSDEVLKCLRLPSFDCNECSDEEILRLLFHMYTDFKLDVKFNISTTKLQSFLFQVYKNYNEVPFHNFRHSFCVTQMVSANER